eukprot:1112800-Amphidinium_carterae.1
MAEVCASQREKSWHVRCTCWNLRSILWRLLPYEVQFASASYWAVTAMFSPRHTFLTAEWPATLEMRQLTLSESTSS